MVKQACPGAAAQTGQVVLWMTQVVRRASWVRLRCSRPVAGLVQSWPCGAEHQEQRTAICGKRVVRIRSPRW
ncbi:hypothetical protein JI76_18295 [Streptomyces anulatus]|nr:hypothetical protein JI76_18295 [Streptomyces anulatus]